MSEISITNDLLRGQLPNPLPNPHKTIVSATISKMTNEKRLQILNLVKEYNQFDLNNDPNDEHDIGVFDFENVTFIWKFDYYNNEQTRFKENGIRTLTVMLDSEY
jgi:predicted enzyme involved in methoxymalonyl-ACP biosynthesis